MFGYIKPNREEMKVKEYNTYKAVYCGLCKCMGRCVSGCARFTLSYDFVFLALLRIALTGEKVSFEKGRCMAHPIRKKVYMASNDALQFGAKASVILTYYQLQDGLLDHRGAAKLKYRLLLQPAGHMRKRASGLQTLDTSIQTHLDALHALEAAREESADSPAEIFGRLLGETAAFGLPDKEGRIAYEICFHIGKWIYFADALDDFDKDLATGAYNPLALYSGNKADAAEMMVGAMAMERAAAKCAFDLVDCEDAGVRAMLYNILCEGLPLVEKNIMKKMEKQHD